MHKLLSTLVLSAALLAAPTLSQEGSSPECVPSYVVELRELAKLKDEGIITAEEFEAKKRRLLGLNEATAAQVSSPSPDESPDEEAEPAEETLLEEHCRNGLLSLMRSPASTKILKVSVFASPELPKAMKRVVTEGQSLSAPGTTVYIEYDSANSYGALLRGKIACDYTDPPYFENEMAIIPRTVSVDGKPLDRNRAVIFGIDASLKMIPKFSALRKKKEAEESND